MTVLEKRRLDVQHIAARLGPRQTGRDAGRQLHADIPAAPAPDPAGPSKFRADRHGLGVALRETPRHLAGEPAQARSRSRTPASRV